MAHVVAPNLRGKGISATKVTKDGRPKRSGNWSTSTIHYQSLQFRDYKVLFENDRLIVRNSTPLADVMGKMGYAIEDLAKEDQFLNTIVREGYTKYRGKEYESRKRLTRTVFKYSFEDVRYIYREEIYTDGDFDYSFPEY